MEPVYYGHIGINQKCPDYQGIQLVFQVNLYDKPPFGTISNCVDYAGVLKLFSSVLINRFHCTTITYSYVSEDGILYALIVYLLFWTIVSLHWHPLKTHAHHPQKFIHLQLILSYCYSFLPRTIPQCRGRSRLLERHNQIGHHCWCGDNQDIHHHSVQSIPTLGSLGAHAGNFEKLHPLRLNLRAFLVIDHPLMLLWTQVYKTSASY